MPSTLKLWTTVALAALFVLPQRSGLPEAPALALPAAAPRIAAALPPPHAPGLLHASFGRVRVSHDVRRMANWVVDSGDNQGQRFLIVDKRRAHLFVFDSSGLLRGDAPVLLGLARGDDTVPGIGDRPLAQVRPEERTTPAGRFVGELGRNLHEDVVWVDYDAAVSMHRVITNNPAEHRLRRLATPTVADNRVSYGCINVPAAFFDEWVRPAFDSARAIIYVLPDKHSIGQVFAGLYDVDQVARLRVRRVASVSVDH
ncbi:MAG TPA: hypothetical protein VJ608_06960 [Albitalea sp.]|nr:hypothetical protein [Albitalea sp.]